MTTWFVDDHGNFEIFDNLENLFVLEYPTTSYWVAKTKEHDDWHLSIM